MNLPHRTPVPGLTRDLTAHQRRGPGSSPGRDSPFANLNCAFSGHAAFCLHLSLTPRRRALYRADTRLAKPGRGASCGTVQAYCKVQHSHTCLVRGTRGLRTVSATRTHHQTLAARLEKRADHRSQSKLARFNIPDPLLSRRKVPAQGRDG